jgi:hypothetical protein
VDIGYGAADVEDGIRNFERDRPRAHVNDYSCGCNSWFCVTAETPTIQRRLRHLTKSSLRTSIPGFCNLAEHRARNPAVRKSLQDGLSFEPSRPASNVGV